MAELNFEDSLRQYYNMSEEDRRRLEAIRRRQQQKSMEPLEPLVPGFSTVPTQPPTDEYPHEPTFRGGGEMAPGGGTSLMPNAPMPVPPSFQDNQNAIDQYTQPPPEPVSPYFDPSQPMNEADASSGGLLSRLAMRLGGGGGTDTLAGGAEGGGWLGNLGNRPWGPMLMSLGGGIASGANQGWGAGLGRGFQAAALARMRGEENAQQQAYRQQLLQAKLAEAAKGPAPTTLERQLQAAGLKPGTPEYQKAIMDAVTKPGASVSISQGEDYKILPDGRILLRDPSQPNGFRIETIPGGKAAEDEASAETRAAAGQEGAAAKAGTMLQAIEGVRSAQREAILPATGTLSGYVAGAYSETSAAKLRGNVDTLKSGVALGAMTRLKEASKQGATGFGNMNQKELQLLLDDLGSLNPDGNKDVFDQTMNNIERRFKVVRNDAKKNISPERWQELGLDEVFGPRDAPASGGDPLGIR